MHTIEGALRAQGRRDGRFLACRTVSNARAAAHATYLITCVLDATCCDYLVRIEGLGLDADGEEAWRCLEVRSKHSCISTARSPNEKLKWRLDWWASRLSLLRSVSTR